MFVCFVRMRKSQRLRRRLEIGMYNGPSSGAGKIVAQKKYGELLSCIQDLGPIEMSTSKYLHCCLKRKAIWFGDGQAEGR